MDVVKEDNAEVGVTEGDRMRCRQTIHSGDP